MLYSELDGVIESQILFAKRVAAKFWRTEYVCSIDDGGEFGERSIITCDDRYLDCDEFAAFDGAIIFQVEPSGEVS